ncbi:hypothetical protein Tco_0449503 [Tanacetum coccineum]
MSIPKNNNKPWTILFVPREQVLQIGSCKLRLSTTFQGLKNPPFKCFGCNSQTPLSVCTRFKHQEKTVQAPKASFDKRIKSAAKVARSGKKKQLAKGLETLSEIALSKAEQMKLAIERRKTQLHSSQPSGSDYLGKSSDEEDDEMNQTLAKRSDDDDLEDIVILSDNDNDQGDGDERIDLDNDGDDFVHPKFSTHDEEDSFDPRVQISQCSPTHSNRRFLCDNPASVNPEVSQNRVLLCHHWIILAYAPPKSDHMYIDSIFNLNTESTSLVDVLVTAIAEPPLLSITTTPPPPTPLITHLQQTPAPTLAIVSSSSIQDLPNFGSLFGFN